MANEIAKTLFQKSANVLKEKKSLLIFMGLSNLLTVIAAIACIIPVIKIEILSLHPTAEYKSSMLWEAFLILFIFFTIINFLPLIFSTAVIACAIKHLQKESYSLFDGFKIVLKKAWKINRWQSLGNLYGLFFIAASYWMDDFHETPLAKKMLAQLPWRVATALMLPILVENNIGIRDAIAYCADLTRKTWCQDPEKILASNLSPKTGYTWMKAGLFAILIITVSLNPPPMNIVGIIMTIICSFSILFLNSITSTIENISLTATYLFSQKKEINVYYDETLLEHAFEMVKRKKLQ